MKAIIMAGGFGSRLRPLTDALPKPMVPIINKPILEYIVELLRKNGIVDIAMTLGYKPEIITRYFGDGTKWGVNISYYYEDTPLGTAGGVKNAKGFVEDRVLVISGDAFTNIDIEKFVEAHLNSGGLLTMAVKYVEDVKGFGVVQYDDSNKVIDFVEKPAFSQDHMVNTGIYIIEKALIENIPCGKCDFSRDLFPMVMDELRVHEMKEYWSDIGTLGSYYMTNYEVANNAKQYNMAW